MFSANEIRQIPKTKTEKNCNNLVYNVYMAVAVDETTQLI